MGRWVTRDRVLVPGPAVDGAGRARPRVMAIVNVTPDSFSDGGKHFRPHAALAHARSLIDEGADLLDIGGESSRPGAAPVELDEELRRVLPVIETLASEASVPISIDTNKPEVARRAVRAGASILNDIGGLGDPAMVELAAETGAGVVVMHMAGTPRTMQTNPTYRDVVGEVFEFLKDRVERIEAAGVPRARIAVDPGIGFGKTLEHNLALLRNLGHFASLGCVVLVGTSRKGMLGALTGRPVSERLVGSVVSSLAAASIGAAVVRVHDVAAMVDALTVWGAIRGWD